MLVLGDAHACTPANRRALFAAYRATEADVALQAGDLMFYSLPVPTYFIGGNNEDFDVIDALRHGRVRSEHVRNARLLASTASSVGDLAVAGLSGNFAPSRFYSPRAELVGERRRHFTAEDVERAKGLTEADVLLVHEAPNGLPVEEEYDAGCEHINDLIAAVDPELCLVGHHHQHAEATVEGTHTVALAPVWDAYYDLDPATLDVERRTTPPA